MGRDEKNNGNNLHDITDYDIFILKIQCVQTFANVASKMELEKGIVFDLGNKLFDDCIETIKKARGKLSA